LYFKVDDSNRAEYEKRGMERFRPYANKPQLSMTYYTAPVEVLEDSEQATEWGKRAVRAALNSAHTKGATHASHGRPRSKNAKTTAATRRPGKRSVKRAR
jgi:TfoX/Sxy family transcriptional regulator of competence genes